MSNCDDTCRKAVGDQCDCICGGKNHGCDWRELSIADPWIPNGEGKIIGHRKTRAVYINGDYLTPDRSQKAYNHSPDGFMWGYGGSGPAQLALAILIYYVGEEKALKHYQEFKRDVITTLPTDSDFIISEKVALAWIKNYVK